MDLGFLSPLTVKAVTEVTVMRVHVSKLELLKTNQSLMSAINQLVLANLALTVFRRNNPNTPVDEDEISNHPDMAELTPEENPSPTLWQFLRASFSVSMMCIRTA